MQSLIRTRAGRAATLTTAIFALMLGVFVSAGQGGAVAVAESESGTEVGVSSDRPLESYGRVTLADLQRLAGTGKIELTTSGASPTTETPRGYKLIHPGYRRSNYVYDSDWVYQADVHCNSSGCRVRAQTKVRLHEYVYGGLSHSWRMTYYGEKYSNPAGLSWQFHIKYYCGVNVKDQTDHICTNGASSSGREVDYINGESFDKTWGKTNSITVFPMAALSTHFSSGIVVTTKFRGYDTLSRSRTTRLNTSSGTGN